MLATLVSGCDTVFGFQTLADAADADAAVDANPCATPTGHDEDHDGIDDSCDNCPTVANTDQANGQELAAGNAADEVGDACDPAPMLAGDYIALFVPFTTPASLRTGGSVTFEPDAVLVSGDFSFIGTLMNYHPTTIAGGIHFANPIAGQEVQLSTNSGGFRCVVSTSPCLTIASVGCLSAQATPTVSTPFDTATALTTIVMAEADATHLVCTASTTPTSTVTAATVGMFADGQITVYTIGASTGVFVDNLIAYATR